MSIVIFSILVVISLRLGFRPFGKKSLVIAKWLISGLSVATSIVNGEIARSRLRNMYSTTLPKALALVWGASLNLTVKLSLNRILSTSGLKAQKSILSLIFISLVNSKSLIGIFQLWLIC